MRGRPRPKPSETLAVIRAHAEVDVPRQSPPTSLAQLERYHAAAVIVRDAVEAADIRITQYAWRWRAIRAQAQALDLELARAIGHGGTL